MSRTLICKDCGLKVEVNKYKGKDDSDYLCAKCRKVRKYGKGKPNNPEVTKAEINLQGSI